MANLGFTPNRDAIIRERDKKKTDSKFYTFQQGKTVIRVMPPYSQRGVWFRQIQDYFFKIDDEILSLSTTRDAGHKDPIKALVSRLYSSENPAEIEFAKDLRPRTRFLINAVVISDPNKGNALIQDGVKIIALPVRVKEQLVEYDTDEDAGFADITNVEQGFNVVIEKSGKGLETRYTVKVTRDRTNILDIARQHGVDPNTWSVNDLDAAAEPSTTAELQAALDRFLDASPKAAQLGLLPEKIPSQQPAPVQNPAPVQAASPAEEPAPFGGQPVAPANVSVSPQNIQVTPQPVTVNPTPVPDVPPPPVED